MRNAAKKLRENLTRVLKTVSIDELDDDSALAILQDVMNGFEDSDWSTVHNTVKTFQSHMDRSVEKIATNRTQELNARLSEKEKAIEELKLLIPRASSPEEIKKRLDSETDPVEKRILQVEYQSALIQKQLSESQAEKEKIARENQYNSNVAKLAQLVKEKDLPVHDVSVFARLGDDAEAKLLEYGENQKKYFEESLNKMAGQKFGGAPKGGESQKQGKLTLEQINEIPDRGERLKALAEAGY